MRKTLLISAAVLGLAATPALAQTQQSPTSRPGINGQSTGTSDTGAATTGSMRSPGTSTSSTIKPPGRSVVPPTGGSGQQ